MPMVEIFTAVSRSADEEKQLMIVVRDAVSTAFAVEAEAVTVWLRRFGAGEVLSSAPPGGLTQYLVHCFAGRSQEQKKVLYSLLCAALTRLGEDTADFQLTVEESPLENWGLGGGLSAPEFFSKS